MYRKLPLTLLIPAACAQSTPTYQVQRASRPIVVDGNAVEFFINPDPSQTFYYGMEMNARATLCDYLYVFRKMLLKICQEITMPRSALRRGVRTRACRADTRVVARSECAEPPEPDSTWTANLNPWE